MTHTKAQRLTYLFLTCAGSATITLLAISSTSDKEMGPDGLLFVEELLFELLFKLLGTLVRLPLLLRTGL
ncbi:hypothetical protein, partial [Psychrobacter sp. SMN/5/1215-MNA-CIBAN-0208]|uniref:hypothetical protein n=1 Tax=Psychrobacter sp. SMN/5/1215-MNA-CIBAN-0208 TaxID=3140442 RepID=UPI00332285AD